MAISEPILAFTLTRLNGKGAADNGGPPHDGDELARRVQDQAAAGEIGRVSALGKNPTAAAFQYEGVPVENVAELAKLVFRIRASHRRHLEAVYEIGADLLRAKELLGHGKFLPWLQSEFRWSERTANNYMSIARFFQDKAANFADLDIGTASALAARSTAPEIRETFTKRAAAGETITRTEVKEWLAASREMKQSVSVAASDGALPEMAIPSGKAPHDIATVEASAPPIAQAATIVERLNAEELMLTAAMRPMLPPPLPGLAGASAQGGEAGDGRRLIDAMLEMERFVERLAPDAVRLAAEMLLAAQSGAELQRVRRLVETMRQVRAALDREAAAPAESEMLRAS